MRIVFFQPLLHSLHSVEYKLYSQIINNFNQLPIVYSDRIDFMVDHNIPLFHTFYLRNFFDQKIIITDINGLDYLYDNDSILASSYVIVLYNRTKERIEKNKSQHMYFCDINLPAVIKIIKDIINEQLQ